MKHTLVLIRHAQAQPHAKNGDHARPLSAHGHLQASILSQRLALILPAVDYLVYSDARRTQDTAQHLLRACRIGREWSDRALYHAGPQDILALTASFGEGESAAIVGHEPSISQLGGLLAADPRKIIGGVPTATALILQFDAPWEELSPHSCTLDLMFQG